MRDEAPARRERWIGLLGPLVPALFALACAIFPVTDTDVWWHLSAGRWMWEHGSIPRFDPFCLSSLGKPWLDAQWGFQLLVYGLWNLGGVPALVLAKAAAVAAIFALSLARGWTSKSAPFLFALGVFAAFHARHLADIRPVWITALGLAVQYRVLRDHLDARAASGRGIPWIPLLLAQFVMVQMQGLHWLGPAQYAVMLAAAGARPKRAEFLTGAALALACLANPYGLRGALFPLQLFARILPAGGNVFSSEVAENVPFWRWLFENPSAALPFVGMGVVGGGLLAWTRARGLRVETALFLMYALLGALAQRNLVFFVLGFLWVSARAIPALTREARPGAARRAAALFVGAWGVASVAGHAFDLRESGRWELPGSWETPFRFPSGATAYLRAHPLRGPMFNEMRHGGYLGWHLGPEVRPFIDGRMILHDAAFMREFLGLFDHPERFEDYHRRHGISIVVLPIGEDDRYLPLAASLAADGAWTLLYCDGADVLVARPEAWSAASAPARWTPHAGADAAEARFGANPWLLARARARLSTFEARVAFEASKGRSTLRGVLAIERETAERFPEAAAPSLSLPDSLEAWRLVLQAEGFEGLSDSARAETLARFFFDRVGLRSVDAGDDLRLSLPSRVLRDREGSCVGLSLLLMALAERLGVDARPVFLPGHVFVRLESGSGEWRNVELLRGGLRRSDAFYVEAFRLPPGSRPIQGTPQEALAPLLFNRGNASLNAGDAEAALGDYRAALRLRPGFPEARRAEAAVR